MQERMTGALLEIPYRDPVAAFAPFRDQPHALLLHGAGAHPAARWSLLAPLPASPLVVDGPVAASDVLAQLRARLRPAPASPAIADALHAAGVPFVGGLAGFFAYEFGGLIEATAPQRRPVGLPLAALARHDVVAAFDHAARRAWIAAPDAAAARRLAALLGDGAWRPSRPAGATLTPQEPDGWYGAQVDAVRTAIRRGDVFQANVSRRCAGRLSPDDHPFDLFARLAAASPAPFQAYLRLPDAAIVSNSPERHVAIRRGPDGALHAETSPIKGTRPRGASETDDARLIAELLASEKEKAENLMIVDLMRNDLARVCSAGSVRVPVLFGVETFANVHHLVSTVRGRLREGCDAFDLLAAVFPAGSITGAPKLMAQSLIDSLESAARGASYGGIGWFGDEGGMDLNVTIRTAACVRDAEGWQVEFRVGGGITIDSAPDAETEETVAKARSLVAAITGEQP
ncbi:MAG: anthranilate synthase component I family protein [Alphaproteobacteria bacterium]|nr:anthranilate synthase component I family protein [Alphaproteobacteria bacterium]